MNNKFRFIFNEEMIHITEEEKSNKIFFLNLDPKIINIEEAFKIFDEALQSHLQKVRMINTNPITHWVPKYIT
jgi:hypothetical protein